ncbi:MAG TPA: hypothetical protein VFO60_08970 [Candidatus Dormibacteraeota bacterium]|nr:hypothetical protein [Candidatus Dormibacteraeota bacterium]
MAAEEAEEPVGEPQPQQGVDELAAGVADVLRAAVGVGTAVARTVARTAGAAGAVPRADDAAQLGALVQSSLAAAGSVARVVVYGIGVAARAVAASPPDGAAPGSRRTGDGAASAASSEPAPLPTAPEVHAGSTLRVPLSVENPDEQPLALEMRCSGAVRLDGAPEGTPVPALAQAVRFDPATLTVAPRDFEKVTVFVDVPVGAAAGPHRIAITDAAGSFSATLDVRVHAPAP